MLNAEEKVLQLEEQIIEARATKNIDKYKELMSDQFFGKTFEGKTYYSASDLWYLIPSERETYSVTDLKVSKVNDVTYKVEYMAFSSFYDKEEQVTSLWRLENEDFKLIFHHSETK